MPTDIMTSNKSHTYSSALRKYMILQEQHEVISSHLEQIRHRKSSVTSASTRSSSPRRHARSGDRKSGCARARCSGWDAVTADPLDTILDEETLHEIFTEENRLFDVNESIKRGLTKLLNCDVVRGNNSMRLWAQTRLMETEKELRSGRRRRSSPCYD